MRHAWHGGWRCPTCGSVPGACRYHESGPPAMLRHPPLRSGHQPGRNPPWHLLQQSLGAADHAQPRPDAVACRAPSCATHPLIPAARTGRMGMNLDVTGVNHQPCVVWRQVPPRHSRVQDSQHHIEKTPVVLTGTASSPCSVHRPSWALRQITLLHHVMNP